MRSNRYRRINLLTSWRVLTCLPLATSTTVQRQPWCATSMSFSCRNATSLACFLQGVQWLPAFFSLRSYIADYSVWRFILSFNHTYIRYIDISSRGIFAYWYYRGVTVWGGRFLDWTGDPSGLNGWHLSLFHCCMFHDGHVRETKFGTVLGNHVLWFHLQARKKRTRYDPSSILIMVLLGLAAAYNSCWVFRVRLDAEDRSNLFHQTG